MDDELVNGLSAYLDERYDFNIECKYVYKDNKTNVEIKINDFLHNKKNEQILDEMKIAIKEYVQNKLGGRKICITDFQYNTYDGINITNTNSDEIYLIFELTR